MIKRFLAFLLTLVICLSVQLAQVARANTDNLKTVRVGYLLFDGYQSGKEGEPKSGYGYEYLQKVAYYAGWRYEYVYGDFSELLSKLAKGEIDLMGNLSYTPERAQLFNFAAEEQGREYYYLFIRKDNEKININNLSTLNGKRIGIARNSVQSEIFKRWAVENGISCELVEYESGTKRRRDMAEGVIDATVSPNITNSAANNWVPVTRIGNSSFYYGVSKSRPDLLQDINSAMLQIHRSDWYYNERVYLKYYSQSSVASNYLLPQEQEWLGRHHIINVGYIDNVLPYCSADYQGKLQGILAEFIRHMKNSYNVTLRPLAYKSRVEMIKALQEGKIDIMFPNFGGFWIAENEGCAISESIVSSAMLLLFADDYSGRVADRIAVNTNYPFYELFTRGNFPNAKIIKCSSLNECLEAVRDGHADCTLMDSNFYYAIKNENSLLDNMVVVSSGIRIPITFSVRNSDKELLTILNKGCNSIASSDAINARLAQLNSGKSPTLLQFARQHIGLVLVCAVLLILLQVIVFMMYIRKLHKSGRLLRESIQKAKDATENAKKASRAKSEFLANMSHDIRTPMNAIIGLTAVGKLEVDNPAKMREYLSKIEVSSHLLLDLINDILCMSAIERGKMKINNEPFNFRKMLSDLVTVFYQQSKQKGIDFKLNMYSVTEERLIGDELRINQILMNLLGNSIKFTPPGGTINFRITQSNHTENTVTIRFEVSDTGIGMSEDMLKRIFVPFEQQDSSVTRKYGGSGLGMAITKNLTEMMHGRISVNSKLNEGTHFIVELPLEVAKDQALMHDDFSSLRVLIVDDDVDACVYCSSLLKELGIDNDYVTSGEAALAALGEAEDNGKPYQMCFIDWQMQKMDGIEVTRQIRRIFGKDSVIVIVSAFDLDEIESEGIEAGANFFMMKPFFQSSLISVINSALGHHEDDKHVYQKYNFKGRRVLIAEDVALNMEVAVKMLNLVGVQTRCAENGQEAIALYENAEDGYFDCILMDVNMPMMNGLEAAWRIRHSKKPDAATIQIYAMTANVFAEDIKAVQASGMNGHIAKPVDVDSLYNTLQKAFEAHDKAENR